MVTGTLIVQIPELQHLAGLLEQTHTQLLDNGGSRVSGGQVGNGAVAGGLSDFYGNWDYRRKALAERLDVLSGLLMQAADWYAEQETSLSNAARSGLGAVAGAAVVAAGTFAGRAASAAGGASATVGTAMPTASAASKNEAGSETGTLTGSDRSWQQVQADYDAKYSTIGQPQVPKLWSDGAPGGENQYQCVSWAWFRLRELGYQGPQVQADGGEMAAKMGGTTTTLPHLGAVISYPGHVMIAESVTKSADGHLQVVVSEMNTDSNWAVANPNEYKASRVLTQAGDGRWTDSYGQTRDLTVFNPGYPS